MNLRPYSTHRNKHRNKATFSPNCVPSYCNVSSKQYHLEESFLALFANWASTLVCVCPCNTRRNITPHVHAALIFFNRICYLEHMVCRKPIVHLKTSQVHTRSICIVDMDPIYLLEAGIGQQRIVRMKRSRVEDLG